MNPKAGFHLYDKDESIQAFQLREQLRSYDLSADSINTFLERIRKESDEYLTKIKFEPIGFLNVLKEFEEWLKDKGPFPTKAKTVAQTMIQVCASPIMRQGVSNHKAGKIKTFITYYDYSEGMMDVLSALYGATRVLEGTIQQPSDEAAIKWLKHRKVMPAGAIDTFEIVYRAEYQYFAGILREDPTGLEVIAEMVRELEYEMAFKTNNPKGHFSYPRILPYQYPKLYIAGANFAKQIYESLYNLWEDNQCSSN
jgi:hypothetical protein